MFSVITKHLEQENQRAYLNGIVHSHRKSENVFFFDNKKCSKCALRVTWHTLMRYSNSCHTRVNMVAFCLQRHPDSVNCIYHARMVLSVGKSFAYFAVTTELLVWYCNTQNDFSSGEAIFSLHTLGSPSGRYVNHDERQMTGKTFFELFLLSVQVS